jgi:PAS domain S-box-containing protein
MPGNPARVNWNLPDPAKTKGDEAAVLSAFRQSRDEIRHLVDDLVDRGYLAALTQVGKNTNLILDGISDGIIAHDLNRRIFYFNKAAEEITGYRREDVMGRDCHEVFPGKFCGGKCLFCEKNIPSVDCIDQEIEIARKDGERRILEMSVSVMKAEGGRPVGVLASFCDVTRQRDLARRVGVMTQFSGIIGKDERMLEIYDLIRDLAESSVPVLIQGESGTGKELVAAAIHNEGARAGKQFVPVNCGALPETLLESELFGHVKGAFTGAIRDKKGRFELADGGTIFLDEIGDVSPAMQVRLMRVLQEGTFERVGSEKTIKVDVRVISATNKDLQKEIAAGRFRDDLYYRLSVVPVRLPPLRERRNDIPLLSDHILKRALETSGRPGVRLSPEALDIMLSYDWPGNVRELQNWIQFALVKCKGAVILPEHLPPSRWATPGAATVPTSPHRRHKLDIESVREALRQTHGNRVEAARLLGVSRATLYRFLPETGLEA